MPEHTGLVGNVSHLLRSSVSSDFAAPSAYAFIDGHVSLLKKSRGWLFLISGVRRGSSADATPAAIAAARMQYVRKPRLGNDRQNRKSTFNFYPLLPEST